MDKVDLIVLVESLGVSAIDLAPYTPKWDARNQLLTLVEYVAAEDGREEVDENGAAKRQEIRVSVPDTAVPTVERLVEHGLIAEAETSVIVPPLTREQAAIIGAYTQYACGPFGDVHKYIQDIIGRPVWTHELAQPDIWEKIHDAAREDFVALAFRR